MTWRVIAELQCGCDLITNEDGDNGEVRPVDVCVYHLCRLCGHVPAADSEPDRLCGDCWEKTR